MSNQDSSSRMMNHRPSPPPATTIIISKRHLFFISLLVSVCLFSFQTASKTIVHSIVDYHPSIQTHFQSDHQPINPQPNATLFVSENKQENESSKLSQIFHITSLFLFTANGFAFTQSWAHGIIFVLIVHYLLKSNFNQSSLILILKKGAFLGFRRLTCFFIIRLMIRSATIELAKLFFGDIEPRCKYFGILNFIPFSHSLTWVEGIEFEYSGFTVSWLLLEMFVSSAFHAIVFVGMMDSRKTAQEVISEAFRLLSVGVDVAKYVKVKEYIISRVVVAVILKEIFGKLFASFMQSVVEGYFMVTWMMYYFHVKSRDAKSRGYPFGKKELEAMLQDV